MGPLAVDQQAAFFGNGKINYQSDRNHHGEAPAGDFARQCDTLGSGLWQTL
jgi:hypothetical protein